MDRIYMEIYYELLREGYNPSDDMKRRHRAQLRAEPSGEIKSLILAPRTFYDEDGEGYTEYGIYNPEGMSDTEIEDGLAEEYDSRQIHSPYDCTGKTFMSGYHWRRLANGYISVIKRFALDV